MTIRMRILLPLCLLLTGLSATTIWAVRRAGDRAELAIEERIGRIDATLARSNFPLTVAVLEQMRGLSGADFALLDRLEPRHLTRSEFATIPWRQLINESNVSMEQFVEIDGKQFRFRGIQLGSSHPNHGSILVILLSEQERQHEIREAIIPPLAIGLVGSMSILVFIISVADRFVRRIQRVQRHTHAIAQGEFAPLPLPRGKDEIRDLAEDVNRMASKLGELQSTLRRTERLHLLGQLAAGLAHQLRNGLTGIKLALQLHQELCSLRHDESFDVAYRQLDLLEINLRRFIDLGQPGSNQFAELNLRQVITEAIALIRPQAYHLQVTLDEEYLTDSTTFFGDATSLGHVIINLLTNAVEAAGPSGEVRIWLLLIEGYYRVCIEDTGSGPPETIQNHLFEPFITGKPGGIGLGLAVAREAVLVHRGSIHWRRVDDRTRFEILLPTSRSPRQ